MEESWVQHALIGSLILMAAYSVFFCFEYRDKTFILFAGLATIPAFNIVLREWSVLIGPMSVTETVRWILIVIGWAMGAAYIIALFKLREEEPPLAKIIHYVMIFDALAVVAMVGIPKATSFGVPLAVTAISTVVCLYICYRPERNYSSLSPYVAYACLSIGAATAIDWLDMFAVEGAPFEPWLYLGLVISGMFSLSITKIHLSNALAQQREIIRLSVEQKQKMAALGEISSSIAHEIKNPLAAMIYAADLQKTFLQNEPINKEQLVKLNQNMEKTALQIDKIVNSLRDISRHPSSDPFERVSLRKVLEMVSDLFEVRLRQSRTVLHLAKVPEHLFLECRETQICQVILNLLNNAFDAVENHPEPWIKIETSENEDAVCIAVVDSGTGIDPAIRAKILKTIFTTKPKGKGSGLGLSICKSIVQQHYGKLQVVDLAANTRFEVWLPKVHGTRLTE